MKIQATFYTMLNQIYKVGVYKTMKVCRNARERYELRYGACLRMVTQEAA